MAEAGTPPLRIAAIILAAGASARMGSPKQLLPLEGRTLLERSVEVALNASLWPVIVVLGAHREIIRPTLTRYPVLIAENSAWPEGMASSIRAGLQILGQFSRGIDAALLAVCDQPAFSSEVISTLIGGLSTAPAGISAARYAGRIGTPAVFRRSNFPALAQLQGEYGARDLLQQPGVAVHDFPELALDLDTPEQFAAELGKAPRAGP